VLIWPVVAVLVAVVVTWPAVLLGSDHLLEPLHLPDVQGGMYWPWAFAQSVLSGEPIYHRAELLWPAGQDVRLLIWNHGVQLLIFPLFALLDPILATNTAALLIATVNGIAGAWAGWSVSGRRLGALLGLVVAVASPYGFIEAGVGRPEQGLWAPLALWMGALARLWSQPDDRRTAVIAGVALALAGAVYWFYAIFSLLLLLICLPLARPSRAHLRALVLTGGIALLVVSPFLVPVALALLERPEIVSEAVQANDTAAMQSRASLRPISYLGPLALGESRSWRLPMLLTPLLLVGMLRGARGVRMVAGAGVAAAVLCAGPELLDAARKPIGVPLPGALLDVLPGFERFWWPYRWQAAVLAAATVVVPAVIRGRGLAAVVIVMSLIEGAVILRDGGQRSVMGRAEVPALFRALGTLEGTHPILQLPGARLRNSRVGWIPWHGQPIDGGMGAGMQGADAPSEGALLRLIEEAARDPAVRGPEAFTEAEAGGFHYVIFYQAGPAAERGPLKRGLRRVLGAPFYAGPSMMAWAVPGLAEPVVVP